MASILIIDDDRHLCDMISDILSIKRHAVEVVHDGLDGLELLRQGSFDLLIVDWNLPRIDGVDICKQYRSSGGKVPILMLTARTELNEKEQGFEVGADDYLTKPFEPRELYVRVYALLRRAGVISDSLLEVEGMSLDCSKCKVERNGQVISLSPPESILLEYFMRHHEEKLTVLQLLER